MKTLIILFFGLLSFNTMSATEIDVEFGCLIEGHGGGCSTERIALPEASGSYLEAEITEESCFDDGMCDFCQTYTVADYSSNNLNYLPLVLESGDKGLKVKEGRNVIKVKYYEEHGLYEGSDTIIVNVTSRVEY